MPALSKMAVRQSTSEPKRGDRWPEAAMAHGYTQIPSILFWGQGKLGLKPGEFNVLLQLVSHCWTPDQIPHPSKETIASRIGKNSRTVQRHLTTLENADFIKRETRFRFDKGQDFAQLLRPGMSVVPKVYLH